MIRNTLTGSTARVLAASTALVLAVTLSACGAAADGNSAGESELPKIRVASNGPIPAAAELVWGIESGIFEEHGVEVQMTPPAIGQDIANFVLAGNAEVGLSNGTFVASGRDAGRPLVMIGTASTPLGVQLVFTNETDRKLRDQGISESSNMSDLFAALSGMTLGTYSAGSVVTGTFRYLLAQDEIIPEEDNITLQPMPDSPSMVAAVANDRVDGVVTSLGGAGSAIESQGEGVIWRLTEMAGNEALLAIQNAGFLTSEAVIVEDPKALESFLAGFRASQQSLRDGLSVEDSASLKAKIAAGTDQAVYDELMAELAETYAIDYVVSEDSWDAVVAIAELLAGKPLDAPFDEAVDNSFAINVMKNR